MNIYIFKGMGKTEAEYQKEKKEIVEGIVNAMIAAAFPDETLKKQPQAKGNQPA